MALNLVAPPPVVDHSISLPSRRCRVNLLVLVPRACHQGTTPPSLDTAKLCALWEWWSNGEREKLGTRQSCKRRGIAAAAAGVVHVAPSFSSSAGVTLPAGDIE